MPHDDIPPPTAGDLERDAAADLRIMEDVDVWYAREAARTWIRRWRSAHQRADIANAKVASLVEALKQEVIRSVDVEAECARLRQLNVELAERSAGQAEVLSRRAEKKT